MLCGDDAPVLFEQGDIGMQIERIRWIPRTTFAVLRWIKGAPAASLAQVKKFTNAIKQEMKKANVAGMKLAWIYRHQHLKVFGEEKMSGPRHDADDGGARSRTRTSRRRCAWSRDRRRRHWEFMIPAAGAPRTSSPRTSCSTCTPAGMEDVEDVICPRAEHLAELAQLLPTACQPGDIVFMDLAALTGTLQVLLLPDLFAREGTDHEQKTSTHRASRAVHSIKA